MDNTDTSVVEAFIHENLRYDPETGNIWWIKQVSGPGRPRDLTTPAGTVNRLTGRKHFNICINRKIKKVFNARVAWFISYGAWPPAGYDIHHRNEDPSDDRLENLECICHRRHGFISARSRWDANDVAKIA